ncbi:MAG: hypothetical protein JRJ12_03060 [Deltaproteobacteria bacterium]|nr:hypothetical protein [Deltaproteobacteria bacterium]MBW2071777.1 hypothetical protein [Deltaproteobacteria bacterium]
MKINKISPPEAGESLARKNTVKGSDRDEFSTILNNTLQTADQSTGKSSAAAPSELVPLEAVSPVMPVQTVSEINVELGIQRVSKVLDILADYQNQLQDADVTLKQMAPTVRALEGEIEHLAALTEQQPLPEDLQQIARDLAVTLQVEVSKFHRGDYVA